MAAFVVLCALVLAGAVWVVTLRNLFRAALSLGVVLLGIAGLFILLHAEFLAFVQILVYVGAILVLIIFAIMLTAGRQLASDASADAGGSSRQRVPAAIASAALFILLVTATRPLLWPAPPPADAASLTLLGTKLVTTFVLPFEVVSLVFVAAMVGAIALAAHPSRRE